jgi:hypothetical protein
MIIYENPNEVVKFDTTVSCIIYTIIQFLEKNKGKTSFNRSDYFLTKQIKNISNLVWSDDSQKLTALQI